MYGKAVAKAIVIQLLTNTQLMNVPLHMDRSKVNVWNIKSDVSPKTGYNNFQAVSLNPILSAF